MFGIHKKKIGRCRKLYIGSKKIFEYYRERGEKELLNLERQKALNSAFNLRNSNPITHSDSESSSDIIISLTTYGRRATEIHIVIESILQQICLPKRILLWLDESEFLPENLPKNIQKLMTLGVDVRFCENYRSYKKIIPTLKCYPNDTIVTIDDDVMYPKDFLKKFVLYHQKHPGLILCYRAHRILFNESGYALPYSEWEQEVENVEPSSTIFPTGVGGVLYPAGCFAQEVLDAETFTSICPNADDIWLKAMTLKNNANCWVIPNETGWAKNSNIPYLDGTQENCLAELNVNDKNNDKQLSTVFEHFNLWHLLKAPIKKP